MKKAFPLLLVWLSIFSMPSAPADETSTKPLRLGVAGLVHGHVGGILSRMDRKDIRVVGISEPDAALGQRMAAQFHFDPAIVQPDIDRMLDTAKPEAVVVFTSIHDHLEIIRACAKRGIDVMVEKPLALTGQEAREIEKLAAEHHIQVLTNYETTWYPTVQETQRLVAKGALGEIRKMIACDGHEGPKEIGVSPEFLAWLTDPVLNGGGALVDFGCYGADMMTWLMKGERPKSVVAVTQKFKTDPAYAKVEDEATILLLYAQAQGIIQASWNWPYNRKDLAVYGTAGAVIADDRTHLRERSELNAPEKLRQLPLPETPYDDPFSYFVAVVHGKIDPSGGPSSLPINVTVVEILDAARQSAKSGQPVELGK